MKVLASFVGLLWAITAAPLALQAQQFSPASAGMSYGGPSEHESSEYLVAPCHSAPYGYLWNGYCEQRARHYACRMHHAMNAAAIASNAAGACPSEKFQIMKDSIGSSINIFGPCGHCPNCRNSKAKGCSACKSAYDYEDAGEDDLAVPPEPGVSNSADFDTVRPVQEPVLLTPVESPEQGSDNAVTSPLTPRSPVVRLAPEAPQAPGAGTSQTQPERTERRIPRNAIPPRPASPRSAAIPVTTDLSNGSFRRH